MSIAAASSTSPAPGLAQVRNRISEIQRRAGVAAAWSVTQFGQTPRPAVPQTSFAAQLNDAERATAATAAGAGATSLSAASLSGSSLSGSSLPASLTDPAAALSEALGTTPVYATEPATMPPVNISDTMRAAGNGNLPDSLLASVGGGFRLAKPAADAYQRMVNAARRDGVTFGLSDGYRTYADQVDIADRLGLYGQGGVAAVPGTSNHGWGLAVDLDLDDRAQAWMRENGWRYGFFEDVPGEPWHWTYRA
ncbi:MAG: D-alanyl-D-alanine carboxypeptidase family protein [Acidimicrobiia bacterium]